MSWNSVSRSVKQLQIQVIILCSFTACDPFYIVTLLSQSYIVILKLLPDYGWKRKKIVVHQCQHLSLAHTILVISTGCAKTGWPCMGETGSLGRSSRGKCRLEIRICVLLILSPAKTIRCLPCLMNPDLVKLSAIDDWSVCLSDFHDLKQALLS